MNIERIEKAVAQANAQEDLDDMFRVATDAAGVLVEEGLIIEDGEHFIADTDKLALVSDDVKEFVDGMLCTNPDTH